MIKNADIQEVVAELQKVQLELLLETDTYQALHQQFSDALNHLITNNFSLLISILYRLDISEKKLKALLTQSDNKPAGDIIAEMIIERQLQKIAARKAFSNNSPDIPEEEKW